MEEIQRAGLGVNCKRKACAGNYPICFTNIISKCFVMSDPRSAAMYFDAACFYSTLKLFRIPKYNKMYNDHPYLYLF